MTTKNTIILGVVLAVVAFTSALIGGTAANRDASLGASINAYQAGIWQFGNGLYAGSNQQLAVDSSGNIALSNSVASSSVSGVACFGGYASSTATPWKLIIVASSTQVAPGYQGLVYAKYGTCP